MASITPPWEISLSPDGRWAYLTDGWDTRTQNRVAIYHADAQAEMGYIDVGRSPQGVAVSANGKYAYVACRDDGQVAVVDTASRQVVAAIPVGEGPYSIALMEQIGIAQSEWRDPLPAGWTNHYNITLRNHSPLTLWNVIVQDYLPMEAEFLGTMGSGGVYDQAKHQVHWLLPSLAPGQEATLQLRFRALSSLPDGRVLVNRVFALHDQRAIGYDREETIILPPPTPAPSSTPTPTEMASSTATMTPTPTFTASLTPTMTPTSTPSPTLTETPGATESPTAPASPTVSPTPTASLTASPTPSPTPSLTATTEPGGIRAVAWHDLDGDGENGHSE
ncbi:MAG: DUF11 domain-containing protein, partial [Chloroflexi bacterium]|nr:DUF11 domain-containing protein [Chloroflexota bacterium]